ncbi:GTP-binding protein [Nocardioides sp. R-C-SC26]|uniref:CobW family GTP-binding protein n=1 Tax=Nocardioides sp. R-C-SC26 TaxID=2870414 RepID=UPI001E582DBD|nr:GTP-binding protein [Nocardioides sp. R-C-SC26]
MGGATGRVPVVALTGELGAGKTTVLNHLLRQPGARVGVVVNDFGEINIDAALVTGQVDEPVSIAGGCVCCVSDTSQLDDALERLTHPRLGLDVVVVETSGLAEPATIARMIRYSGVERVRPGGLVAVIDAVNADVPGDPRFGVRYSGASLIVLNKCDLASARRVAEVEEALRAFNEDAPIVHTRRGCLDPTLVFDVAVAEDPPDQLPIGALLRASSETHDEHVHARAVSATSTSPIDAGRLVDLLVTPPPGAYRLKGLVCTAGPGGPRRAVVHVVGRLVHVLPDRGGAARGEASELVAIGLDLDEDEARRRLAEALAPAERVDADGVRRLARLRRLSQ